jgi:hypothetical protein
VLVCLAITNYTTITGRHKARARGRYTGCAGLISLLHRLKDRCGQRVDFKLYVTKLFPLLKRR